MGLTNPAETYFDKGLWVWNGTLWVKASVLWGYTDVYGVATFATSDGSSPTNVSGGVVPTGEVWTVTNIVARHNDPVNRTVGISAVIGGAVVLLTANTSLAQWALLEWGGEIRLKATDYVYVYGQSVAAASRVYIDAAGYKMAVV